jgi:probable phosphoglycerate mutase
VLAVGGERTLVVAHNAVNQALLAVALGLPPSYFRKLPQSNAASNEVCLSPGPGPGAPPVVRLLRVNQSPGPPFKADDAATEAHPRVLLLTVGPGASGGAAVGAAASAAAAELLSSLPLAEVFADAGCAAAAALADAVAARQTTPPARRVAPLGAAAAADAWDRAVLPAATSGGGRTVAVVLGDAGLAAMVARALALPPASAALFAAGEAGALSMLDLGSGGVEGLPALRCMAYSGHL